MNQPEERTAELERIQAGLASQDRVLEELFEMLESAGSLELPLTTRDLDDLFDNALEVRSPADPNPATTGIRC